MFHIIRRIHHVLFYVVDHFTLKMKFWRKNTLLEPVDIRLMNLKERLQNIKSYFHKSMMYILGMTFFLLWHVKEKGNEKQGLTALTKQGMLTSRAGRFPPRAGTRPDQLTTSPVWEGCFNTKAESDTLEIRNPWCVCSGKGHWRFPHRVQQLSRKCTHEFLRTQGLGCQCVTNSS